MNSKSNMLQGSETMKPFLLIFIMILCGTFITPVYGFENENTTLKNEDSESYEYTIKTAGGEIVSDDGVLNDNKVVYGTGVSYGKVSAHSKTSICKQGCELTLTKTGQTITVNPGDSVVIDKGVMSVQ